MYNRYHNYVATQLRRINENGRFEVPPKYRLPRLAAAANSIVSKKDEAFLKHLEDYDRAWRECEASGTPIGNDVSAQALQAAIDTALIEKGDKTALDKFYEAYDAACDKLDDDLFNTARL